MSATDKNAFSQLILLGTIRYLRRCSSVWWTDR